MNRIQAHFQIPVLLDTPGEWRFNEKCFEKKKNLKMTHTTEY